jgi:hypothetical protein
MSALHPTSWPARSVVALTVLAFSLPASAALAGEDDAAPPPQCGTVAAGEDCTVVPTPVPTVAPTPVATPAPAPVTEVAPVRRTPERTAVRKQAPRAERRPVTAPVAPKPRIVYVYRTVGSTSQAQQPATPVGGVGAGGGGTAGTRDEGLLTGISGLAGLLLLLGGAARATMLHRRAG